METLRKRRAFFDELGVPAGEEAQGGPGAPETEFTLPSAFSEAVD